MKIYPWITGILVLVSIIYFLISISSKLYVEDYFAVFGLQKNHLYESVKEIYGIPKNINAVDDTNYINVQYDGIEFVVQTNVKSPLDEGFVTAVRVYSSDYRFGKKKIGVGSTREEIDIVYKKCKKIVDVDCGFIDGLTWIEFYFDDNNEVIKIVIYNDGP